MMKQKVLSVCLIVVPILLIGLPVLGGVDYSLDVRLDRQKKVISGSEVIRWSNQTEFQADELRFHLYFNAWKDSRTSFLNSARVNTRDLTEWEEGDWAYCKVSSLVVVFDLPSEDPDVKTFKSFDLTGKMEFIQPDDSNPYDQTVMRVNLPEPVAPGQAVRVEIDFETKVPRPFARVGTRGDYFFLAHWFPKLGVFEAGGTWNCHQFIQTEFYSEFGDYDVKLTLPGDWKVGATGRRESMQANPDGSVTHRFFQERVHGFAWTASPYFREFNETFEHPRLPNVEIRLLLMPDHLGQQDRYFAATRAALQYYGEWFGEYPYGHLTVVDPAWRSRSGGMEYPTLFTGGTRWLNPRGSGSPEGVTVHECGHQFWYGIVANNEFEDAWLDEGFNSYSTLKTMEKAFGDSYRVERYLDGFLPVLFSDLPEADRSLSGLGGYYSPLKLDRMSVPSWEYGPEAARKVDVEGGQRIYGRGAYGVNSYDKPAMMLLTLERYLGWDVFQKIMSTYFERWKFKHPRPDDFFEVVQEVSGRDLDWFWQETYHSSNIFDFAVDNVVAGEDEQTVVLRRWGEGRFPVTVEVTFEDGDSVRESWDGQRRWLKLRFPGPSQVERVVIDPDQILALEVARTNNSWVRNAPSYFASKKWALKWMVWLQSMLESFAFYV